MTTITCTIHGNSTVTPKFLDCPWCVESDLGRFRALADELAEALDLIKESDHLDCMDDSEDAYYSGGACLCGGCRGRAALAKYRDAIK